MHQSEKAPDPRPRPRAGARPNTACAGCRYHPFYCEENAWWLCAEPALGPGQRHVVFIVNRQGACPLAAQKAVPPGELCWWDYHVVVLDGTGRIWDLDTRLGCPLPASAWLDGSFPFLPRLPANLRPLFRLIPAAQYRAHFGSDRSHMRTADGGWLHPPPPWPAIGSDMLLAAYSSAAPDGPGELLDWEQMRRRVDA